MLPWHHLWHVIFFSSGAMFAMGCSEIHQSRNGITRYFGIMERCPRFLSLVLHYLNCMRMHVYACIIIYLISICLEYIYECFILLFSPALLPRSPQQATALDKAGMTYIDAHLQLARMSFLKLCSNM